jgi:hypothetical protein
MATVAVAFCLATGATISPCAQGIPEPDLLWYGKVLNHADGHTVRLTAGILNWTLQPDDGGPARSFTVELTNLNDQFSYVVRLACESPLAGFAPSPDKLAILNPPTTFNRANVTFNGEPLTLATAPIEFTLSPSQRGRVERVDLAFSALLLDGDGDGLPDIWEDHYFPGTGANPEDDADGDGVSNLDEYLAGTDPIDPDSLFAIVTVAFGPEGNTIQWSSIEGRAYRILRADTLSPDGSGFEIIQYGVAATPPLNTFLDDSPISGGPRFYRLQLEH